MPRTRLTEQTIKAIPAPVEGYTLTADTDFAGLAIRTTAGGVKSFTYQYRTAQGRSRRVTLGRWPTITATAARLRAKKLRAEADTGNDPAEAKQRKRREGTLSDLIEAFAERHLSKKRSGTETARILRADVVPALGRMKASEVKRADVRRLIEAKTERTPVAANRLLSALSRLFNWAMKQDIVEHNPAALIDKAPEQSRDRVLSEAEIKTVWEGLETAEKIGPDLRAALKLILVTLARPGEVCGMRWVEIDGDTWEIPAERSKNGKAHRVPLNGLALEILEGRAKRGAYYVFPSANGAGHLQRMSLSQGVRRSLRHFATATPWKPHDLRRTAASQIAALGVPRWSIERLLNHTDRAVTGIYDRYQYMNEKRAALAKWDRRLRAIIAGQTQQARKVVGIDG